MVAVSFGYSGSGTGTNTRVLTTGDNCLASVYKNDTGGDVLVSSVDILGVNHLGPGSTPSWYVSLYSAPANVPFRLLGVSDVLAGTLVAGTNTFAFSTPVLVRKDQWVGVALSPMVGMSLFMDGAIATRRGFYPAAAPIHAFPDPWVTDGAAGVQDFILPALINGDGGPDPTGTELRLANLLSEPLTEGASAVRVANLLAEPLTEGTPNLRLANLLAEPLTEGGAALRLANFIVEALQVVPLEREMATDIFPTLIGLTYNVKKSPTFNTSDRRSPSLKSVRNAFAQYAAWDFKLEFDYLPDDQGHPNSTLGTTDYRYLTGFFMQQRGMYGDWLFSDPDDHTVTLGPMLRVTDGLTTGDGVTTEFWFARALGPATEPVGQVKTASTYTVYVAGVAQTVGVDYTFVAPNRVTFTVAPALHATVTATFDFYFVCHFLDDTADFEKFMDQLWELGELTFRGEPQ